MPVPPRWGTYIRNTMFRHPACRWTNTKSLTPGLRNNGANPHDGGGRQRANALAAETPHLGARPPARRLTTLGRDRRPGRPPSNGAMQGP
eukprot:11187792-Lingulodinium_polyedra.AAC.1